MVSPYSTAVALKRSVPAYINAKQQEDLWRIQSYWTYDDILSNVAEAFGELLRVDDDTKGRRYVPYARAVLEGTNRYLGQGLTITYDAPLDSPADPAAQAELAQWVKALFDREQFGPKFSETKRTMLRRGDAFIQISADTSKPQGQVLRITMLDGAQYFRIPMGTDVERIAGCYIITLLTAADGSTQVAQREWYQKILTEADQAAVPGSVIGGIYYKMDFFEVNGWDDRFPLTKGDLKPVAPPNWVTWSDWHKQFAFPGFTLPAQITALPVYHFKNSNAGPYGHSLLQGLETVLAGITQGTTDEDMAIALAGIGVFWTDSGSPRDANGKELPWVIAPASVLELGDGKKFGRVEGVTSVAPIQDHVNSLKSAALEASGTPDIAVGQVDVAVAESGVALLIKMAPVIAGNREREEGMAGVLTQMMFDLLNGWAVAYEGRTPIEGVFNINASFDDAMPVDRDAVINEVVALLAAKIIDVKFALQYLSDKLGFQFPADMLTRMASADAAALDAQAGRLGLEAGAPSTPPAQPAPAANPAP